MVTFPVASEQPKTLSLQDYLQNPLDGTEWVDGQLVEKNGVTLRTSQIQSKLDYFWRDHKNTQRLGGEVYTEPPCRTRLQVRRPDVAYLTADLLTQFGQSKVLPQSFPLIAEIVSPTDCAEDVFSKANEYLESGCQEVWLILPESYWIIVITQQGRSLFTQGESASTQLILPSFSLAVDELLG
jgi:Uma2 family endonuclease